MNKRPLTQEDLEKHLTEQIQLLQLSAESFDKGFDAEAKRMAVGIRILLHESKSSHSLLGQLNKLDRQFYASNDADIKDNPFPYSGLVMLKMGIKTEGKYVAMLDDTSNEYKQVSFKEWWEDVIFDDKKGNRLSRKDIIITAANQDGGAHVDPNIEEKYAKLSKDNSMGWTVQKNGKTKAITGIEKVAIRQITHEVLKTLVANYKAASKDKEDGIIFGGLRFVSEKVAKSLKKEEIKFKNAGRNDQCPCGSGRKFKKCHWK
ncbi:MAG: SEC-C domain-containing protein [Candidatus Peregrinibacteria bacterium]|nr:SEC-C domain-containing protein [Candidatus Peregrinibacteria bacterium]